MLGLVVVPVPDAASGGNCGSGVVGAGVGVCESYIVAPRIEAAPRESVLLRGLCRTEGGLGIMWLSAPLAPAPEEEEEFARDRWFCCCAWWRETLEGWECRARERRSEAVDFAAARPRGVAGGMVWDSSADGSGTWGEGRGSVWGMGGGARGVDGRSLGESRGVVGWDLIVGGRPDAIMEPTGLRLYFEVGGRMEDFVLVEVMDDRAERGIGSRVGGGWMSSFDMGASGSV